MVAPLIPNWNVADEVIAIPTSPRCGKATAPSGYGKELLGQWSSDARCP